MNQLDGVYTALVTPFQANYEVDEPAVLRLLAFQEAAGVDGVVVCGTNGEGPSLTVPERKRLYELASEGRGKLKVIAGTASCSLMEVIYLARHAQNVGCDALLVTPPYFFKSPSQEGLLAFYRALLESVDLPVILYHIPRLTYVPIEPGLVEALLSYPNLLGVKDSEGNAERMAAYLKMAPRLRIYIGQEEHLASAMAQGAAGSISGASNAFPEWVTQIYRACRAGEETETVQARLNEGLAVLRGLPFPAAGKYLLSLRGLPPSPVRPPVAELTADQRDLLRRFAAEHFGDTRFWG